MLASLLERLGQDTLTQGTAIGHIQAQLPETTPRPLHGASMAPRGSSCSPSEPLRAAFTRGPSGGSNRINNQRHKGQFESR